MKTFRMFESIEISLRPLDTSESKWVLSCRMSAVPGVGLHYIEGDRETAVAAQEELLDVIHNRLNERKQPFAEMEIRGKRGKHL